MLVPVLAVFGIKRPLLVVIAATVSLWGATLWAGGSWILSLLWGSFGDSFGIFVINLVE